MNQSLARSAPAALETSSAPAWLDRSLYPFVPRAFETDAGVMRYLDEGRGPAVLVVHGTPSWSFEWRSVVLALRSSFRVVVPDHLGFGLSDKPDNPSTLHPADHARRLTALVEALDLRDAVLVGHDFGGPIGLAAAQSAPSRFAGVVLANTWLGSLAGRADVRALSRIVASPIGRLLYRGFNASPRWIVPSAFGDKRLLTRAVRRHYTAPFPSWRSRAAPWKLGVELAGSGAFYEAVWNARAVLAELPARIVWGDADPTFRAPELARLVEAFPSAVVTHLAGCGHFPAEERPDAIVEAVVALAKR